MGDVRTEVPPWVLAEDAETASAAARHDIPAARLIPAGVDVDAPNFARTIDYCLGGGANFAADRAAVADLLRLDPGMGVRVRANRAFLVRAVRWCVGHGIDQFLDLGCGIPSIRSVHATAQALDPTARVAYVDVDPVAVAHAEALTDDVAGVSVGLGDVRCAEEVLAADAVAGLLDLARPVAVVLGSVPHWIPGDLGAVIAPYRDALAPGGALVLSQALGDGVSAERRDTVRDEVERVIAPITLRTHEQLRAAFAGFDLLPPGIVDITRWPEEDPTREPMEFGCGVGLRR